MAIAADVTSAQLSHQKQTTAQLLDTTEKTVNGLNRTLSHDEEEIVSQIHSYVAQSRKATAGRRFRASLQSCYQSPPALRRLGQEIS